MMHRELDADGDVADNRMGLQPALGSLILTPTFTSSRSPTLKPLSTTAG